MRAGIVASFCFPFVSDLGEGDWWPRIPDPTVSSAPRPPHFVGRGEQEAAPSVVCAAPITPQTCAVF